MLYRLETLFLLFLAYAVMGWCMEVACKLAQYRRFINRGFLIGPYCPIYGVGGVLITLLLARYRDDPAALFVMSVALCGTLEYLTSYLMEKLFHARWWDYSGKRFNINGRVCLNTLLPFGGLGLLIIYVLDPPLYALFDRLARAGALHLVCAVLAGLFLADVAVSAKIISNVRVTAGKSPADNTEAITAHVRAVLSRKSALNRRLVRAFPHMSARNREALIKLRARRELEREELRRRREAFRRELLAREAALKKELRERRARERDKGKQA